MALGLLTSAGNWEQRMGRCCEGLSAQEITCESSATEPTSTHSSCAMTTLLLGSS